jgi:hypothetical protein
MSNAMSRPWYREPWPWFLILLPLSAVVASMITIWLAVKSADGLVADDYYKEGMAINKTLHRDQAAESLGLGADLAVQGHTLSIKLSGKRSGKPAQFPESLSLSLIHPTQSGLDQLFTLHQGAPGVYTAELPESDSASSVSGRRWHILLEPEQKNWRLTGHWLPGTQKIHLGESEKSE